MQKSSSTSVVWEEQKVISDDGASEDWFGSSVAVSGSWAMIGAKNAAINGSLGQGAVYVFQKVAGTWSQTQKLVARSGGARDHFGAWVALSENMAIVIAPTATIDGKRWQGAAYVFTFFRNTWVLGQRIVVSNATAYQTLGTSIAFNENYLFIGAGGANVGGNLVPRTVYIFKRSKSTSAKNIWVQQQVLSNPTPNDKTNAFGASVAISGDVAVVGAPGTLIDGNLGQGRAYIYINSGGIWKRSNQSTADDGAARDNLGASVSLFGNSVLAGSPGAFTTAVSEGAVYEFERTGSVWKQKQKILAADLGKLSLFGASINGWNNECLLIGAYAQDNYRGAAYLFERNNGMWGQTKKLVASDGAEREVYGYYTALDGNTALVGSYGANIGNNAHQGAAYFYTRKATSAGYNT